MPTVRPRRIGIFYHADPVGHIPGGIDTVIRGVLKWAPDDLEYTLYGATSDPVNRPIGRTIEVVIGDRPARFVPLVAADPTARRKRIPLTLQFMLALRRYQRDGSLSHLDVLDFHRIEALALFKRDRRPKNVMIHQDMEVIRGKDSDIGWRHAPWLYERVESNLLQGVDRVFCVRQSAVARYKRLFPALEERFSFLPTWVDTTVFKPLDNAKERLEERRRIAADLGVEASGRLLIWVGRLDRQKDPLLLLDAMKVLAEMQPDFHLLMVGDGSMRSSVEERIRSLRLDGRVTLLGAIPPQRIAETMRIADVFVLSSAYEGMPIAILEALATGVPVVTTDVGEVRLVVEDGVNGFVVAQRNAGLLARAVAEALQRVDVFSGLPCRQSVSDYVPERVLRRIYDNHRSQARLRL